jgi:GxxExxY protein
MAADLPRLNALTDAIIGAAIKVHRGLGPGLLESAYLACLIFELHRAELSLKAQVRLPVRYEDVRIDCGFRLDLVVEDRVVVEIKSVKRLAAIHDAQVLTYLKLSGYPVALLINFNVPLLKDGLKRRLNPHPAERFVVSKEQK